MSPKKKRIAIIDDHPIVIQGISSLLEPDQSYEIVGTFHTGAAFLSFLSIHPVDIALLDITLPDGSGIDFCREISNRFPATRILALSNLNERSIITQMLHNGAHGYLLKNLSATELLESIENVLAGNTAFSSEVREIMLQPDIQLSQALPELTKREKQILTLLAAGKRSAQIAAELFISPLTVKTHRATLLQKFQVSNVVMLINKANEYGFI